MFKTVFKIGKDFNVTNSSHVQKQSNINATKTKRQTNDIWPEGTETGNHCSPDYTPSFSITEEKVVSLLNTIQRDYFIFSPKNNKPLRMELEMLAEMNFGKQTLHSRIIQLADERFVVCKEISRLIQRNHNDYMAGVNRLTNIQSSLQFACNLSLQSRVELKNALNGIRNGGLGILLSFRKMQRLRSSLKQLSLIKTLQQADLWLKERLHSGHYKEAAHCCMIFLRALNSFHNFSCCIDLTSKLLNIQHVITTKLDIILLNLSQAFNPETYLDIMAAYHSLGKCEAAIEKLVLNFIQYIKQLVNNILCNQFSFLYNDDDSTVELDHIFSQIKASNNNLSPQTITSTVCSLCLEISKFLFIYFDIASIQEKLPSRLSEDSFVSQVILNRKLMQGRILIWKECERIFNSFLHVVKFDNFSFENVFHIIKIINTFIDLGRSFADSPSSSLVESLRILSLEYFEKFHRLRMDDLKVFLENESWELCPLPFNFALDQFNEFSFLQSFNTDNSQAIHENISTSITPLNFSIILHRKYFIDYFEHFDINPNPLPTDSSPILSSNDICNTVSHQYISQNVILVANTTLITLKCIGRYLQIMMAIKIIAAELFHMLTQLYKYYFYAINMYFADKKSFPSERLVPALHGFDNDQNYYNSKLNTSLSQIVSELNIQHQGMFPNTSTVLSLLSEDSLMFGLRLRIIGIESLIFLSEQIQKLRPIIESIFLQNQYCANMGYVSTFYSQYIDISFGLRRPAYSGIAHFTVNYDQILQKMAQTKWDIKELSSHHNTYIDLIIKEFESISFNMEKVSLSIPIPSFVRNMILEECSSLTNILLVEGFATGKKCTHQGRALMLFDFRELVVNIEKNCKMKVSNKGFVEDYIHAFYLDEDELDKWIQAHKEYSLSQLNALLNCKTSFTKRTTNKLLNLIEKGAPSH